jgi:hypothetical protein
MKATLRASFWLLLTALAWAGGTAPSLSLEQYRAELARWGERVADLSSSPQHCASMLRDLPEAWLVNTGQGQITASAQFLRGGLQDFQQATTPGQKHWLAQELGERLAAMRMAAAAYGAAAQVPSDAHRRLEQILSAREFARLRGPTPLELLWQRILAWLDRHLPEKLPSAESAGPIFAWCMIAAVCCVLGVYLYRRSRALGFEALREIVPFAPSDKSWRAWLAEARAQAAQENWAEAIHLAFWSGVSRLESAGAWRPDEGRTAREYLAALARTDPARPAFAALVRRFETAWYAGRPAFAQDFQAMLTDLEKIGCR